MNEQEINAKIEAAFREGYLDGYTNGCNVESDFDHGHGSRGLAMMKLDADEAWSDSDSVTYIKSLK
jgi:hypothetical protein